MLLSFLAKTSHLALSGGWGVGIQSQKALFHFLFQTEAWVTYIYGRTIRIYLEESHEKTYPGENLTWFVFYLLKIMPANSKLMFPFPVLRYWVNLIISLRSYNISPQRVLVLKSHSSLLKALAWDTTHLTLFAPCIVIWTHIKCNIHLSNEDCILPKCNKSTPDACRVRTSISWSSATQLVVYKTSEGGPWNAWKHIYVPVQLGGRSL